MVELGTCCICECDDGVNNIMTINRRAPIAGRGWGCVQCDLPLDGCIAVLCDDCANDYIAGKVELVYVCRGHPGEDGRTLWKSINPDTFDHDRSKHPEELDN